MMKKIVSALTVLILVISCLICTLHVSAITPIDTDKQCTLSIVYKYDEDFFENLQIKTYKIADIYEDGTYELTGEFKNYPVNIYGITTQAQWHSVTSTLAAYIHADSIAPSYTQTTDANGNALFSDLNPGLYLTTSISVENEGKVTVFEDFITVIPGTDENEEHLYDITAYPKSYTFSPTPDTISHKIVKQWKDNGNEDKRPESVEIDILRNGELYSTQTLSSENNWCYTWEHSNDGSTWQAVERNVSRDYYVSLDTADNTIIVTNSCIHSPEDAPQTGISASNFPFILLMSFSGMVLMIIGIYIKRSRS